MLLPPLHLWLISSLVRQQKGKLMFSEGKQESGVAGALDHRPKWPLFLDSVIKEGDSAGAGKLQD